MGLKGLKAYLAVNVIISLVLLGLIGYASYVFSQDDQKFIGVSGSVFSFGISLYSVHSVCRSIRMARVDIAILEVEIRTKELQTEIQTLEIQIDDDVPLSEQPENELTKLRIKLNQLKNGWC